MRVASTWHTFPVIAAGVASLVAFAATGGVRGGGSGALLGVLWWLECALFIALVNAVRPGGARKP
jgi:hypothetical protein